MEILDTDHTWNNACGTWSTKDRADRVWVWKSFVRGYNPIYMDPIDLSRPEGVMQYVEGNTSAILSARAAMAHTRLYADKMNLAAMTPRKELASSGYCLADPGKEYLVYLPEGGEATVDLSAASGSITVEWFDPRSGKVVRGENASGGAKRSFKAPSEGDAVLYLKAK